MKAAAEVKPSVRRSVEPVAVSITKRANLEEQEAADGITRRSPKLVAADGAGIAMKRARKPEEPSKKEKGAREKSKRSKKRAEEKNKQPIKLEEEVHDLSMEEKIMAKLEEFDKMRAEEKSKTSNQEKRIQEILMRIEKIASQYMTNKVEAVKPIEEQVMTELREKGKKKMKLVTQEINSPALMGHYLSNEVWRYVMSIRVSTFEDAFATEMDSFDEDGTEDRRLATRIRHIENQANLLRQYRTNGHAVLQYQVTDDERDVEDV